MAGTIIIEGLDQIQRDLASSMPEVEKAVKIGIRDAAVPAAKLAENLSLTKIRNMRRSPKWSVNRIGVLRSAVYIAPVKRGVKTRGPDPRRRPNLVALMLGRAYEPAVDVMGPVVEQQVLRVIDRAVR